MVTRQLSSETVKCSDPSGPCICVVSAFFPAEVSHCTPRGSRMRLQRHAGLWCGTMPPERRRVGSPWTWITCGIDVCRLLPQPSSVRPRLLLLSALADADPSDAFGVHAALWRPQERSVAWAAMERCLPVRWSAWFRFVVPWADIGGAHWCATSRHTITRKIKKKKEKEGETISEL